MIGRIVRRLTFAIRILLNYGSDKNCPFCQSEKTDLLGRKNVILHLRKCQACSLMFRWPKETPGFSEKFYQDSYQEVGHTTELPDTATLDTFIANNFAGSPKDFADQIGGSDNAVRCVIERIGEKHPWEHSHEDH